MFDTNNIEINAAFYELYEDIFDDDFFVILSSMKPNGRITSLRARKVEELSEDEQAEVMRFNVSLGAKMKKITPRIAYVGSLLHNKKYHGSYEDYMAFLASCDATDFLNPQITKEVWEKINLDQSVPKSVKNA